MTREYERDSAGAVKPPLPMLARPGKLEDVQGFALRGYMCEPKLDGLRCLAVLDEYGIHLYNRQLRDITRAFPDVCELLRQRAYANTLLGRLVIDGEIFVRGRGLQPDFQLVQHRANRILAVDAAVASYPAEFNAFDVLSSGRIDYTGLALQYRRIVLDEICPSLVVATYTQSEADALVLARTGEGLMLKHVSSRYVPGVRSPAWSKIKFENELEAYVGGVTFGIGKREVYFGGLLLGVYLPGDTRGATRLTYIGTVGTGFSDAALEDLTERLYALRTVDNPFIEPGSDWDLKHYVSPVMQVKVRYLNYTKSGIMRFPRYIGSIE